MEPQDIPEIKRKKHKSDFFVFNKAECRVMKPKRLSCMRTSEYLTMEESKISVANHCIEEILLNVFDSINKAKQTSQLCLKQVQNKVGLIQYFEFYNLQNIDRQNVPFIRLEQQPKNQPKFKVITEKQKVSQSCLLNHKKDFIGNQLNLDNPSKLTHIRVPSKQKLNHSSHFASNRSSKSLNSIKFGKGSSFIAGLKNNQSIIEENSQRSKEKQKKRKQEIIKKLLKQHQQKLKEVSHTCPQPILQQYRAFFTQPETREQQDFRTSFLYLRQLRQSKENLQRKKISKRTLNKSVLTESQSKENLAQGVKLPTIYKPQKTMNIKNTPSLFTQDENGSVIKVKNCQRIDTLTRQYSLTMHESLIKMPEENKIKQISSMTQKKVETLTNPKIKPQSQLIKQNSSILSTFSQLVDEEAIQKSLFEVFGKKNGVTLKKHSEHKPQNPTEFEGLKLPSIVLKKT